MGVATEILKVRLEFRLEGSLIMQSARCPNALFMGAA